MPVKSGDNKIESTLNLCVKQKKSVAISFPVADLMELGEEVAELTQETLELIREKQQEKASPG